jgi:putative transposon-encoded protein
LNHVLSVKKDIAAILKQKEVSVFLKKCAKHGATASIEIPKASTKARQ